jgi:hypothetical protein
MRNQGDKYEFRILLANEIIPNVEKACKGLVTFGYNTLKIGESKEYLLLSAFSKKAYIEIVLFAPRINITIALLSSNQDEAKRIAETLMGWLVA